MKTVQEIQAFRDSRPGDSELHSHLTEAITHITTLEALNCNHGDTIVHLNEVIQDQNKTIRDQTDYVDKLRQQLKVAEKNVSDFIASALLNNKDFMSNITEHVEENMLDSITENVYKTIETNATFETTISFR
jgi:uncharacterized coiled-coil protein SlyX